MREGLSSWGGGSVLRENVVILRPSVAAVEARYTPRATVFGVTVSLMNSSTLKTFTVILRPPVNTVGRSRRWSGHCLDLDLGVSAGSASEVRMRLATSIAAALGAAPVDPQSHRGRRGTRDKSLWDVARQSPIVTRQTVETDAGPIEVRYVQPLESACA